MLSTSAHLATLADYRLNSIHNPQHVVQLGEELIESGYLLKTSDECELLLDSHELPTAS